MKKVGEFDLEKMLEQKTVEHVCEKHGKVEVTVFANMGGAKPYCPICADEQEQANKKAKKREAMRLRLANCGVPERFMYKKYSDFDTGNDPKKTHVCEAVKAYAGDFAERLSEGDSLIVIGGLGTGKTHLISCLVKQLVYGGYAVEMDTLANIIRKIRATWSDKFAHEETLFKRYEAMDLLVIDEVGVGKGSDDERNIAYEIIGRRYNAVKPTLVISNCNTADMADYIGERCVDRLLEKGKVLALDWASYRRGTQ